VGIVSDTTLTDIFITSGVNDDGEAFCTVAAHGATGVVLLGQLSPDEVRHHALNYLGAAEAAEQDAAVLRCVRKLELPDRFAAAVIVELRERRGST
jgi:hypothetical protein